MCFGKHLKNGHHSHNFVFEYLPNFELKLEIPNIMLVCKLEINWSTNKNLTTYPGWTDKWMDARHFHIPRSALRGWGILKCRASIHPRYVVSALKFLFVNQLISNLHTSIILGISSLSSKLGKICENGGHF